jgi:hypothetical protein
LAERLRLSLREQAVSSGHGPVRVPASLGVSVLLLGKIPIDPLLHRPDQISYIYHIYIFKQAGHDQLQVRGGLVVVIK